MDNKTEKKKKLFNATFDEGKNIVRNLFAKKQVWYDSGASGSQSFRQRLFNIVPWLMISGVTYAFGVAMPETKILSDNKIGLHDILMGIIYFGFLKYIIISLILLLTLLVFLHMFPKSSYKITRLFEVVNFTLLCLLTFCAIMPFCLGMTLGATGWLGFSIIVLYGLVFNVKSLIRRLNSIKSEIYGKSFEIPRNRFDDIWKFLFKIWYLPLGFIVINTFTLRIGMWGSFHPWTLILIVTGLGYFGFVKLYLVGPMKMYISTFYFVKYANEFRELWKVSDEQWYGVRKAKKMRKKQIKNKSKKGD